MKNKSIPILTCIIVAIVIISALYVNSLRGYLSDCRFECNPLQTKVWRLQSLNDYIPALEQVLNSMQLAELKALTEQIRQQKYRNYESVEMPLLTEEEKRK